MLTLGSSIRGQRRWLMASYLAASNEIFGRFFGLRNTALKSLAKFTRAAQRASSLRKRITILLRRAALLGRVSV
ncbi:hypothetical protein CEXT_668421 [Caerostris extrusa]|uniref:Ribosomal protein L20 n=1 Tax=Caerostris extrusa TaxID=172846 RepID=A0AAV4UBI8_CAEEX|nr:hypothetical protein CEXT_668421 [Caerostris extrusa]